MDTFTAQCTGNYTIDAWVTCAEGNCTDCKSCVKVYRFDSPFPVGQCSNETCSLGDCENTCTGAASLEQGRLYKLVVCLIPCTSDGNCNTCASTCQASFTIPTIIRMAFEPASIAAILCITRLLLLGARYRPAGNTALRHLHLFKREIHLGHYILAVRMLRIMPGAAGDRPAPYRTNFIVLVAVVRCSRMKDPGMRRFDPPSVYNCDKGNK